MGNFLWNRSTKSIFWALSLFFIVQLCADQNLVVSHNPNDGEFSSVREAVLYADSIARQDEPVFIMVDDGVYEEDVIEINRAVTIDGHNARNVILRTKNPNQDIFVSSGNLDIQGVTLAGATGKERAAVRVLGGEVRITQCRFGNNDSFVIESGKKKTRVLVQDVRVEGSANFTYGFVQVSHGAPNILELERVAWTGQSGIEPQAFVATVGDRSDLIARSLAVSADSVRDTVGVYARDGALVNIEDSLFQNLAAGIFVPESAVAPSLVVTRCVGVGNTHDLFIDDIECSGIVSTCFDEQRIHSKSEKVFVSFDSPFDGETRAFKLPATDIKEAIDEVQAATDANTASTLVKRDASGNFSAGTITASLTGAASLNVLKTGDTMTGNLVLDNQQQLQLRETTASGANYAAIQAPATLASDYTLTLPTTAGTNGYALTTNGSGVLDWTQVATAATAVVQDGNSFGETMTIGTNDTYDLNLETDGTTRMIISSTGAVSTVGALTSGGALTVSAGGAAVTGDSTVTGKLGVSGDFAVATDKFTVVAATGNTAVEGTLTSAGALTVSAGGAAITGDSSVAGNLSLPNQGQVRLLEATAGGTNYAAIQAPAALTADYTLTLPTTAGTNGYALTTNGSGVLDWTQVATAATAVVQDGNSFGEAMTIGTNDTYDLNLETDGTIRMTISSAGAVSTVGALTSGGAFTVSSGGASVTGDSTVTGTLGVSGDFAVATDKFTVAAATGNTAVYGTLTSVGALTVSAGGAAVTGDSTVTGTLGVSSDFAVATNKFTVAAATGNTAVDGTLTSAGALTVSAGGAAITGDSSVTGNLSLPNQGQVRLLEATAGGTNYAAIQAPAALTVDYTLTLPTTAGTNGYALTTNGSGVLDWTQVATAATAVVQDGNSFGEAMTIGTNDTYDLNLETDGTTRMTISSAGAVSTVGALTSGGAFTVSSGGAAVTGDSTVTGTLGVSGDFAVATDKFTVAAATGNTAVDGTLTSAGALTVSSGGAAITGDSTVTGTLGVSSDFAVATDKFTVAAATGNTAVDGTLTSAGALTVSSGGAAVTGNSTVTGTLGVSSDFAVATDKFTVAAATGNTAVDGTLTSAGALTVSAGGAAITGDSSVTGNLSLPNQGQVRLLEATAGGTNYAAIQAPAALTADYTLTLPTTAGTNGYALTTNGSGVLDWTQVATAATAVVQDGNSFGEAMTIGTNDTYDLNLETDGTTRMTISSAGAVSTVGALTSGGAFTVSSGGAAVTGDSTVTGTLGVSGDFAVATDKFTVAAATGNTAVDGTLTSAGALTVSSGGAAITGNSTITGTLDVTSSATIDGILYPAGGIEAEGTGGGGSGILNIGIADDTDTLNLGTGTTAQTINLGTGAGASAINIGSAGDTINIYGDTYYNHVTELQVADKLITINKGGAAASASNSGIEVEEDSVITGYAKTSGDRASWLFKAPGSTGIVTVTPGASGFTLNQGVATTDAPTFTGVTIADQGDLVLQDADGSNSVSLQSPAVLTADYTLTLPTTAGTNGYALTTNGSGVLDWTQVATAATAVVQDGNSFGEAMTIGTNDTYDLNLETDGTTRMTISSAGAVSTVGALTSGGAFTVSSGGAAVTGDSTVTGTLGVSGDFAVATDKFTVAAATGNTAVDGTLTSAGALTVSSGGAAVTGNSTVTGTLGVSSDFAVATDKFTVAAATGNTAVDGTLTSGGALTVSAGGAAITGDSSVTGNLSLPNQGQVRLLEATASGANYAAIQAPATLASDYTLTLPTTAGTSGYALTTNGSGVLDWTQVATAAAAVVQDGNSFGEVMTIGTNDTYDLNLETDGTTRMTISSAGAVSTVGALTSGGAFTVSSGGASVTGNSTVTGTLGVSSDFAVATDKFTVAAATGNTAVDGTLTSAGALTVSAGGAAVTGNSTVTGTLGVSSDFAVATDKFTVAAATGNTAVDGTLTSAGALTVSTGGAAITGDSSVTGNLSLPNQGQVRLLEATAGGTNYAAIQAPAALTADYTLTLPTTAGTSGYALTTNGSGVLDWTQVATAATAVVQDGNSFGEAMTIGTNDTYDLNLETDGTTRMTISSAGAVSTVGALTSGGVFTVSSGGAAVTGDSTVTGTLGVSGDFAVATDKFTVAAATGNTAVDGTLTSAGALTVSSGGASVTGNSTVTGTLGVSSDFAVATDKFTVAAATGNTAVDGTLTSAGALTVSAGGAAITGDSSVTGNLSLPNQGQVRLLEATVGGTNYAAIQAPAALTADYTLTLPTTAGTNGYALTTNGSGVLDWTQVATAATAVVQDGNSFGEAMTIGTNDTYDLNLETDGTTRMTISSTGAVSTVGALTSGGAFTVSSGGADITGNLDLDNSSGTTGVITKNGGTRFLHNYGTGNTFLGASAGNLSLSGTNNVGIGVDALTAVTSGGSNAALGYQAGNQLTTGASNVLLGYQAGTSYTGSESNNICIGHAGVAAESNKVRVGNASSDGCYVYGVYGSTVEEASALAVVMDSNHHIGTVVSSQRFKENIRSIGDDSDRFAKLRPVMYTMRHDHKHTPMYGLIAEELYDVYPELVVLDTEGQPFAVKDHLLPGVIINEVQGVNERISSLEEAFVDVLNTDEDGVKAPTCKLHAFANQDLLITSAEPKQIAFNAIAFDSANNWNAEESAFVAPRKGTYLVSISLSSDVRSLADRSVRLVKNGQLLPGYGLSARGIATLSGCTSMVELAAGDILTFQYVGKAGDILLSGFTYVDIKYMR